MPFFEGQLPTLAVAPVLYLVIVAVVAFAAVFSKKASQRQRRWRHCDCSSRIGTVGRRLPPEGLRPEFNRASGTFQRKNND